MGTLRNSGNFKKIQGILGNFGEVPTASKKGDETLTNFGSVRGSLRNFSEIRDTSGRTLGKYGKIGGSKRNFGEVGGNVEKFRKLL